MIKKFTEENKIKDMPAINKEIADKFINKFYSLFTNEFWKEPYINYFKDVVVNELNKFSFRRSEGIQCRLWKRI